MIGFDIWDNKELYHKYPKTNETVLELFLSELYIILRGRDVDYEISPEQYEDLENNVQRVVEWLEMWKKEHNE